MKSIGVLGGTFNPIHLGHLIAAQEVLDELKLDRIIFIPSGNPPHKNMKEVAPAPDRFEMVKLSMMGNPSFEASDMEIKREGQTYTYDTLVELRKLYPVEEIYFIIGFDTLIDIDSWKRAADVFKLSSFAVVNRGNRKSEMKEQIKIKYAKYGGNIVFVDIPDIDISSTEIRRRVQAGESIKYLVNEKVETYIYLKGLYLDDTNEKL